MENPEEILGSLEEFAKMKPKDIPRELEEYLKYVAKTGDPIYQWAAIKSLFREKFINVITDFYESSVILDIPPCPNVEMFNYELMKGFILEKLDSFSAAPFTLQRICELLTNPKKEYSRIDKYMRALEKNVLVVSTVEPGGRRTENGESFMNGLESDHEHVPEPSSEINVEEMDESPYVQANNHIAERISTESSNGPHTESAMPHIEMETVEQSITTTCETTTNATCTSTSTNDEYVCVQYVAIEPITGESTQNNLEDGKAAATDFCVTIAAVNVKEGNEVVMTETVTQLTEAIITQVEGNVDETTEEVSRARGEVTDPEPVKEITSEAEVVVEPSSVNLTNMETEQQPQASDQIETVFPAQESTKPEELEMMDSSTEPTQPIPTTLQEEGVDKDSTPSSTSPEPEKLCDTLPEEITKIPEPVESENVSPENSISSSDSSSCQSSGETNITESDETSSSSLGDEAQQKQVQKLEEVAVTEKVQESSEAESVDSTTQEPKEDSLITESLEKPSDEPGPTITPEKKSENSEVPKEKGDTEMEIDVTPESTSDETVKQEGVITPPPAAEGEGNP
ncbi:serine/threonine-protein phosphatase 4 regulatory subunit 2-like [Anthonomus grandis grandis]|uniref:serine/threonine-protein phosphatase 4 regulatory subunit 2-like n=1 Tax=Anthonomus grandis grandis TaxID=2921223 RepID=UPI002165E1CD|nr:serine/threonine-protein phosphatase 4 regulatory subunit 2-like [Anthonomus grandis grandis]